MPSWRDSHGTTPPANWTDEERIQFADWLLSFQFRPWDWVLECYPWGATGSSLENRMPEMWQREWLMGLQRELQRSDLEPEQIWNRVIRISTAAGNGVGKGHSNDLVIPTPSGKRRWGDLRVGDEVFAMDGTPTRIDAVYPRGMLGMYRVTFDDGSQVEVDGDHLWRVRREAAVNGKRRVRGEWQDIDTRTLAASPLRRNNGSASGTRIWDIPQQGAAQYPAASLPIDPYLLGLWLGNGSNATITLALDPELDEIAAAQGTRVTEPATGAKCKTWHMHGWTPMLRDMGLLGAKSWSKFIPEAYLTSSVDQRKALLAGLMDTDGTIGKSNGAMTYDTTSERLAGDVVELVRSLGGKSHVQSSIKQPFYRDAAGEKVYCRPCYRVIVRTPFNPFRVERKACRWSVAQERYLSRWIESIEPCGDAEVTCIKVAHESACYLTNDYVVTHNTCLVAWVIHWFMSVFPNGEAIVTAGTGDQLSGKTWRELAKWQNLAVNGWQFTWTATRYTHCEMSATWFAEARTWSDVNPAAMAGTHENYVLVLFDEASAISKIIWETVEGAFTTGLCFFLCFGNPTNLDDGFHDTQCGLSAPRWIKHRVDARSVSFSNREEIAYWIDRHGEDSDFVRVHVYGLFPRQAELQFIDSGQVRQAANRIIEWRDIPRGIPRLMGCDIARQGEDMNTIIRRQGRKMAPGIMEFHQRDTMATAEAIAREINEWRPDMVYIDGVGIGAGVVDYLRMRGFERIIVDVQSGTTPQMKDDAIRYGNMRAVMWARLREWIRTADLPDNQRLLEELCGPSYKYMTRTDKLLIESKDDMRKRGVKSPNIADALAYTFWHAMPVANNSGVNGGYAECEM